jgi:hypothetical protein
VECDPANRNTERHPNGDRKSNAYRKSDIDANRLGNHILGY